jgi:hypothetical protein
MYSVSKGQSPEQKAKIVKEKQDSIDNIKIKNASKADVTNATTVEEYNYMSKGYKMQIDGGLDMKKGYSFIPLGEWNLKDGNAEGKFIFKGLVRQGQSTPCGTMMIYRLKSRYSKDFSEAAYICIPTLDATSELWETTFKGIPNNDMIAEALMKFSSQQTANVNYKMMNKTENAK